MVNFINVMLFLVFFITSEYYLHVLLYPHVKAVPFSQLPPTQEANKLGLKSNY